MNTPVVKTTLRWSFFVIAVGLLAWAVAATWNDVLAALSSLQWHSVVIAFLACVVALGVNGMSWRAVMRSIGLRVSVPASMRVFLLSQAGKYIPGAVWPVLAQAEFARDHGVSRARAMTGSIVAMVVGVVTSAIVGAVGLVVAVPGALVEYWWVLVVALALATALLPPVLSRIVAVLFRITRRPEAPARIGSAALLASAGWSVFMWILLGVQAWLLLRDLAPDAEFIVATGAFAFAWLVGFLVIVAPAGVGAREAAFVLAVSSIVDPGQALSIALVSRFLMTGADALGIGVGAILRGRGRAGVPGPSPRGSAGTVG